MRNNMHNISNQDIIDNAHTPIKLEAYRELYNVFPTNAYPTPVCWPLVPAIQPMYSFGDWLSATLMNATTRLASIQSAVAEMNCNDDPEFKAKMKELEESME